MPRLSTALRDAMASTVSGMSYVDIYSGSIPATGETAPTGTLLVSFTGTLFWNGATAGVNSATVPATSDAAVATGTAGYARVWDGATTSMYCTVGTSGAEVNLSSLSISATGFVDITSAVVTAPAA